MKIIFAGNNERAIKTLKILNEKQFNIDLVISHYKNDQNNYFKNLKKTAKDLKLKVISPKNINDKFTSLLLNKIKPDLMILCGFSQNIVRKHIYSIPKFGTWNLHASDLPKFRGAAPLNWAIIKGEKKIGLSIIRIDEGVDTGAIIGKKIIKLKNNENIRTLSKKVNVIFPQLLLETIKRLKLGKIRYKKQNEKKATYYSKRFHKDSEISFKKMSADLISKLIRASVWPYSGAFFFHKKKKFFISENIKILKNYYGIPGRIIKIDKKNLIVICKYKSIKIEIILFNKQIETLKNYFKIGEDLK